ncbi:hypothetical protein SAMN05892883_0632 [Jatrophihabitans sp. GAS493]|uniref:twin-arginine translocation signal domain-containing protein n=1 Tax=Jatrophihabitans sp. GAS493 TaxID=1907575 RepID=UPI000BB8F6BD|nr:twin-arginine translocation signal domain-containing protein [Jatrophihabitans sp. GAS493]SOD71030.1 hypothetical protein SAMN05892883_0632 [Jatrophihabitans sp. GAS493]
MISGVGESTEQTSGRTFERRVERIVERVAARLGRRAGPDRRGFLRGAAIVGAAVVTDPLNYLVRPASAYATVCGTATSCSDGYTVFCCTINGGQNVCPPDSFIGGWWKADHSSFCGGSARYYVDCNAYRDGRYPCHCNKTTCDQRLVACNQFRYGQCSTHIPSSATGPVLCRLVSCTPPWQQYGGVCSTASATDNNTATQSAPCVSNSGSVPIGSLDRITTSGNTVQLSGWALDRDQPGTSVYVAVYEDGRGISWFPTNAPRSDVNRAFAAHGNHGFNITLKAPTGRHTFDLYAINVGAGSGNPLIARRSVDVNQAWPVGQLDVLSAVGNDVHLGGWAFDPDIPSTEIKVAVYVDGALAGWFPTGVDRPDVDRAFGITGKHGYNVHLNVADGHHTFAVYGINVAGGGNNLIAQRSLEVNLGAQPRGNLDSCVVAADTVRVNGWAFDPNLPANSINVAIYTESHGIGWFPADRPRSDVNAAFGLTGQHGFDTRITLAPGLHTIYVYGINVGGGIGNPLIGRRTVRVGPAGVLGSLDAVTPMGLSVALNGWAFNPDEYGTELPIAVVVDGSQVGVFPSGHLRPDVNRIYAVNGNYGFAMQVSTTAGDHTVAAYAVDRGRNVLIGSRTVRVTA